jgi:membrane-associated protease RseP (regulator of RpoE activity)
MLSSYGVALIVFITYWGIVEWLKARGELERRGISAIGPILMVRTTKGLELLEKLSKNKKPWRLIANLGIPAVFIGMTFMFFLIIIMDIVLFTSPPPPSQLTHPRSAFLIPGVNPLIPLVWGLIGLAVTLIVHEFSHAILCRVEGVRVKAMGILLALIPIGGFAEPDEDELMGKAKINRMQRIRIFSAGVVGNFIVAIISFSAFFYLLGFLSPLVVVANVAEDSPAYGIVEEEGVVESINGIQVHTADDVRRAIEEHNIIKLKIRDGSEVILPRETDVRIIELYKGYPAMEVGLKEGMIIFKINNKETPTLTEFKKAMSLTKPGETISVHAYQDGEIKEFSVTLASSPFGGDNGFMGVVVEEYMGGISFGFAEFTLNRLKNIPSQLTSPEGWLIVVAMPLAFRGFSEEAINYFEPTGFWEGNTIFYLLNTFYWVGWINFYVGLFNCLPAIPLDGGRVFHELLSALLTRRSARGEEISKMVVKFIALVIFSSIILSILIPNIPRAM